MALYPPLVASSMPAFRILEGRGSVRVYYSLSTYNVGKQDEIKAVHVTVRRQNSNTNVLSNKTLIVEKSFGLQLDIDKILNRYYIDIDSSEIDGGFVIDGIYKVQLRFSSIANTGNSINFYTNNINNFSEWSTVCIIKAIQAPEFYIDDFYTGEKPKELDRNNFYSRLPDFIGIYKQGSSSESLKHWRLRLLTEAYTAEDILNIDNFTLADSGIVLNEAENYNYQNGSVVLTCSLLYELTEDITYKLLFEILTKNNYQDSLLYNFTCSQNNINTLEGKLTTYINEEEGYIKLNFTSDEIDMSNLVIRRTDSKSNFLKWEDLKFFEAYDSLNFTYYDFTAESGLFYRYLVQKVDARGRRGTPVYDQSRNFLSGVMAEWEHAFLLESTGNGELKGTKQLKLKYDFQISSYKTNISLSKTDTIGSKYPFIRRNGTMYYRSFPITGTITGFMDLANLFTNSDILFDNNYDKYKEFRGLIGENIGQQYDYTYERKFREKVEEFLYNSKPKLYKSMQLGNIFIKLMEVSLTPKNELGRLVYSFSATAYEIDEAKINVFDNYSLIHIGTFNPNISVTRTVMGQLNSFDFNEDIEGNVFKAGLDIIGAGSSPAANSIAKAIKYNEPFNGKITTDFTINWLRLTIESDPYLIIELNGEYRPFDDTPPTNDDIAPPIDYQLYQLESTYNGTNIYLGWLFTIGGKQIIISPPNNIYEIKLDSFSFKRDTQIIPAKDVAMLVDYRLIEVKQEDLSTLPKNIRINKVNGQLIGTYSKDTLLISRINYKYKYTYELGTSRIKRYVNGVNTISVDTEPGTILYMKTKSMDTPQRFVVNHTGELKFDPMNSEISITSLRITGLNINLKDCNNRGNVSTLEDVTFPKAKDLCKIGNKYYYYYKTVWYLALIATQGVYSSSSWEKNSQNLYELQLNQLEMTFDISCPVDALIFYYAAILEDYY